MWTFITTALGALFDAFIYLCREAWRQSGILLGNAWTWMLAIGTMLVTLYDLIANAVYNFAAIMDVLISVAWPQVAVSGSLTNLFSLANTFLPVNEGIAMLFVLCFLISVGTFYRFVKSWIPTLS
ncbi:MAG: hypothetical protein NTV12_07260 [Verrucomicrobia bacterium]|nr:hypothetical protein [Verrucomicrobiota bacterium]